MFELGAQAFIINQPGIVNNYNCQRYKLHLLIILMATLLSCTFPLGVESVMNEHGIGCLNGKPEELSC